LLPLSTVWIVVGSEKLCIEKMASFVEFVPETDQAQEIVNFVQKARTAAGQDDSFLNECQKHLQEKHLNAVLERVLGEFNLICNEVAEKDLEPLFFVIVNLITAKLDQESSKKLIHKLSQTLTSNPQEKSLIKLRVLTNIYNVVDPNSSDRLDIFFAIVQVARQSHNIDVVIPLFKDVDRKAADWGINIKQKRELYKTIRDALKENDRSVEAHKWTAKYLSTFTEFESSQEQAAVTEEAIVAALDAIRLPELYQFDTLLELFAIKQLDNTKTARGTKIFQLLKIFVGENLDSFNKFIAENPDFLKSVGLDHDECVNKMRLLSLATLGAAASSTNNEVSYSSIAKALHVDESDVEFWVVSAIAASVLDAKMDQLRRVITVSRSLQRVFTRTQYKQLYDNLMVWTSNINQLIKTLNESKSQTSSVQQQFVASVQPTAVHN